MPQQPCTVTTNSQGDWCTDNCYLYVKIQQTKTGHQCSPRKFWQNSKHDCHLEGKWPIGIHYRWPCLSDFLCMLGGSSDLCRLCQFLWDSAEQTTLSRDMRLDSGRQWVSSGVHVCVSSSKQKERVISGTQALELVSLLHLWSISTHFMK